MHELIRTDHVEHGVRDAAHSDKVSLLSNFEFFIGAADAVLGSRWERDESGGDRQPGLNCNSQRTPYRSIRVRQPAQ